MSDGHQSDEESEGERRHLSVRESDLAAGVEGGGGKEVVHHPSDPDILTPASSRVTPAPEEVDGDIGGCGDQGSSADEIAHRMIMNRTPVSSLKRSTGGKSGRLAVQTEDVCFKYKKSAHSLILNNVSIQIPEGTMYVSLPPASLIPLSSTLLPLFLR